MYKNDFERIKFKRIGYRNTIANYVLVRLGTSCKTAIIADHFQFSICRDP